MSGDDPYRVDPARVHRDGDTGIYIRATDPAGRWRSTDIATLDKDSLIRFIHSRGPVNEWATGIILIILDYPMDIT